jgi:hypothetical protein
MLLITVGGKYAKNHEKTLKRYQCQPKSKYKAKATPIDHGA